jgi:hypothetical protein
LEGIKREKKNKIMILIIDSSVGTTRIPIDSVHLNDVECQKNDLNFLRLHCNSDSFKRVYIINIDTSATYYPIYCSVIERMLNLGKSKGKVNGCPKIIYDLIMELEKGTHITGSDQE